MFAANMVSLCAFLTSCDDQVSISNYNFVSLPPNVAHRKRMTRAPGTDQIVYAGTTGHRNLTEKI
jgi:hypothetical protein